jgi:hypothetical protein
MGRDPVTIILIYAVWFAFMLLFAIGPKIHKKLKRK